MSTARPSGKRCFDAIELCAVGNKLVAAANESGVNARGSGLQMLRCGQEFGVGFVIERKSLNLSGQGFGSAVHVVIGYTASGYYVHHTERGIDTACHAGVNQCIGLIVIDEFYGSDSSIHFADTAFHEYEAMAVERAFGK